MNDENRQLGAFILVLAGGCAAVALFLIAPLKEANTNASAALTSAQAAAQQLGKLQPEGPMWEMRAEEFAQTETWYAEQGEPALDPAKVHTLLNKAGRAAGIEISRVEPRSASPASESTIAEIDSVGFTVEATGTLDQFAQFAAAIQENNAFTRIESFSLTPIQTPGSERCRAIISTSHFAFGIPEQTQSEEMTAEVSP